MEREIKNAIIRSVSLGEGCGHGGYLDFLINLDYHGSGQGFGGYGLYSPKFDSKQRMQTCAGHFIWRIMEIAEVTDWSQLVGKAIRVDADNGRVYGIGHFLKDDWFYPEEDL